MTEHEDPLDLLGDDGDGVVEMCLLEEEEKLKKGSANKNSGCCVAFLALGASITMTAWGITRFLT